MNYNIFAAPLQQCLNRQESQNSANCSSHRHQKICVNPSSRCFFPYLAHTSAARISVSGHYLEEKLCQMAHMIADLGMEKGFSLHPDSENNGAIGSS